MQNTIFSLFFFLDALLSERTDRENNKNRK